jgi:hypothetical protein
MLIDGGVFQAYPNSYSELSTKGPTWLSFNVFIKAIGKEVEKV